MKRIIVALIAALVLSSCGSHGYYPVEGWVKPESKIERERRGYYEALDNRDELERMIEGLGITVVGDDEFRMNIGRALLTIGATDFIVGSKWMRFISRNGDNTINPEVFVDTIYAMYSDNDNWGNVGYYTYDGNNDIHITTDTSLADQYSQTIIHETGHMLQWYAINIYDVENADTIEVEDWAEHFEQEYLADRQRALGF